MAKNLIIIFLLLATSSICHAGYEIRLNDGVTLTWHDYFIEGSQYCTQKEFGKFCIQKSDVVALKEMKDETIAPPAPITYVVTFNKPPNIENH